MHNPYEKCSQHNFEKGPKFCKKFPEIFNFEILAQLRQLALKASDFLIKISDQLQQLALRVVVGVEFKFFEIFGRIKFENLDFLNVLEC